ncbi:MAG: CcmD family protein [Balneolaceae bacterium]
MTTNFIQEQSDAAVDTLTRAYGDKWEAASNFEEASGFVQMLASNDLIFVVLGVSLIIWFVLLFFMVRVDRKVSRLEKELNNKEMDS